MAMYNSMRPNQGPPSPAAASEGGFTLLEIMVALAILGGVIVTALVSISYHLSVMDANMDTTFSAMLARSKLAEARVTGTPPEAKGNFEAPYDDFVWKYEQKRGDYKDTWNETITVSRIDAQRSVTIMTMRPEEKK